MTYRQTPVNRLFLQVLSGQTQFPRRPVSDGRFLIGSSTACDMQLGGAEIPPLHSILLFQSGEAHIEVVVADPALIVNDEPVESIQLGGGDRIRIGGIELGVCIEPFTATVGSSGFDPTVTNGSLDQDADDQSDADACETVTPDELENLTAVELVDLIGNELSMIDDFKAAEDANLEALAVAALREASRAMAVADDNVSQTIRLKSASDQAVVQSPLPTELATSWPGDVTQIVAFIDQLVDDLNQRAERIRQREQSVADAAQELLSAQAKLAEHLDAISARLAQRASVPPQQQPPRRASA